MASVEAPRGAKAADGVEEGGRLACSTALHGPNNVSHCAGRVSRCCFKMQQQRQHATMRVVVRSGSGSCSWLAAHTFAKPKAAFSNVRAYTVDRDSCDTRASGSTKNAIARMLPYSCSSERLSSCVGARMRQGHSGEKRVAG